MDGFLGISQRELPANTQAEQHILGTLLAKNEALERVHTVLKPEMFYDPVHQRLYRDIADRIAAGQLADVVTMRGIYDNAATLAEVGGADYLAQLLAMMMPAGALPAYAELVRDSHLRRQLVDVGTNAVDRAFAPGGTTANELAGELAGALMRVVEGSGVVKSRRAADVVDAVMRNAERARENGGTPTGLSSGIEPLDTMLGLLQPSQLILGAGRPGMGKTVLGASIARNVAAKGGSVLLFSLEMSAEELVERLICAGTGVDPGDLRAGRMRQGEWDEVMRYRTELAQQQFVIDDQPGLLVDEIRVRARAHQWRHGLDLVVVDHLGLVQAPASHSRGGITQATEYVSQNLKRLAKELKVPVLALCQLSRANESREDKRPGLPDLRWSGSLEQDADVVMFVHREEYYLRQSEPRIADTEGEAAFRERHDRWTSRLRDEMGRAELLVRKQRRGPTGDIRLNFDGRLSRLWSDPA